MNLLWNLFAKPCAPCEVRLLGKRRSVRVCLTQTEENEPAKVTDVVYAATGKKCRLLARRRVIRA